MAKQYLKFSLLVILLVGQIQYGQQQILGQGASQYQVKCDTVSASVTYTTDATWRTITATGCPGYDWTSQKTPSTAYNQSFAAKLPRYPQISKTKIYVGLTQKDGTKVTSPVMGAIGLSYNGVAIYGNANANQVDAYISEKETFDTCGGHVAGTQYHIHQMVSNGCGYNTKSGTHSPIFGFALDGIPIFGEQGDDGTYPTDLDECGGHVDKTHPYYHYHLPKDKAYPYTLYCLKGCVYDSSVNKEFSKYVTTNSTCQIDTTASYDWSKLDKYIENYVTTTGPISTYGLSTSNSVTTTTNSTKAPNSSAKLGFVFALVFVIFALLY